jgi:undecaprenyl-diphosphatase
VTDFQAIVLGIVQGVTEFLPISSNAHLKIVPVLLGWPDPGAPFVAVCQWGTLLATLIYFRKDIINILAGKGGGQEGDGSGTPDRRLIVPIIVGTIPVVVLGLLLKHKIEHEFRSLYVIAGSMIFFALLLALAEARKSSRKKIDDVTVADGFLVGLGQACALIPGASRSGTTITAALFAGFDRAAAARFSFLLSLPAIFGAGLKELKDERHAIAAMHMTRPLIVATIVAFFVGWVSIDWLMKYLKNNPTYGFIVYRLIVGLALLGLLASGKISDTPAAESSALGLQRVSAAR